MARVCGGRTLAWPRSVVLRFSGTSGLKRWSAVESGEGAARPWDRAPGCAIRRPGAPTLVLVRGEPAGGTVFPADASGSAPRATGVVSGFPLTPVPSPLSSPLVSLLSRGYPLPRPRPRTPCPRPSNTGWDRSCGPGPGAGEGTVRALGALGPWGGGRARPGEWSRRASVERRRRA